MWHQCALCLLFLNTDHKTYILITAVLHKDIHDIISYTDLTPLTLHRLSDDVIECVMPPAVSDLAENVTVCVEYDEMPCERHLSGVFYYEKNPVISIVKPNKSYLR